MKKELLKDREKKNRRGEERSLLFLSLLFDLYSAIFFVLLFSLASQSELKTANISSSSKWLDIRSGGEDEFKWIKCIGFCSTLTLVSH